MKKKYGGLRLVDLEATKTNFLCKCIFKAMQSGESNLYFMLRFRLAILNPQRRVGGLGWTGLLASNMLDSQCQGVGAY
jgi:hypothetical protein